MVLLSHSGKQHSYHVAKALHELNLLKCFYTSSYLTNNWLQRYFTQKGNTYWTRRFIEGLPGRMVDANWHFELPEVVLRALQGKSPAVQRAVYNRDENFDRYVANQLTKRNTSARSTNDIFWGFQGSCHQSLQAATSCGMEAWCELATAHVVSAKKILGHEAQLHPEWASSIDNFDFPPAYEQRLNEEPHLASKVIAASQFTKQTLLEDGITEDKIIYLPLGCDIEHVPFTERPNDNINQRPMKLLYAGTVTQRKGIKYLLEAIKGIDKREVELHIVGGIQGSKESLERYKEHYHYHPPVSQQELFALYGHYDALVLPTVFEGFGLVIVEAMAAGLPVITTPHSIGPELITDGTNGFIAPIRDIDALNNAIGTLRSKSNHDYQLMRQAARQAAMGYSWGAYGKRLSTLLKGLD